MAKVLDPWLKGIYHGEVFVLITSTVLSTIIILVFSEFLPKALFRLDPNGILTVFALPLRVLYTLLWLPMMLFTGLSELFLRLFGVRHKHGQVAFGRIDLDEFLREVSDNNPPDKEGAGPDGAAGRDRGHRRGGERAGAASAVHGDGPEQAAGAQGQHR
jgi:CBS domain containing-hemolysin-like protein